MAAVGQIVFTHQSHRTEKTLAMAFTADNADGGEVSGILSPSINGEIGRVLVVPGTGLDQPNDGFNLKLLDSDGVDLLDGNGLLTSNAAPSQILDVASLACDGPLELQVDSAGANRKATIKVYYR
jgi:hypothetical protein